MYNANVVAEEELRMTDVVALQNVRKRLRQARIDLSGPSGLDIVRWREVSDGILAEAHDAGDIDSVLAVGQFQNKLLEKERRFPELFREMDHALTIVPAKSSASGAILALKASALASRGDGEAAALALRESLQVMDLAYGQTTLGWQVLCEIVRLRLLQGPSAAMPHLLRRLTDEEGATELGSLLRSYVPALATTGEIAEARPLIQDLNVIERDTGPRARSTDGVAFEAWSDMVDGALPTDVTTVPLSPTSRFPVLSLHLYGALLTRTFNECNALLDELDGSRTEGWDLGPQQAWRALVSAEFELAGDLLPLGEPPRKTSTLNLGAYLAAAMATALAGSARDAEAWRTWTRKLADDGILSSLEFPVAIARIEGLLALRLGEPKKARRLLRIAADWAQGAGYRLEAAIAQVQWAEISSALFPGSRPAWSDAANAGRSFLRSVDIDAAPLAHHIHRLMTDSSPDSEATPLLTTRETEILRLLASGQKYKQIGETLGLAWPTVQTHAHRIYEKLGVKGKREAGRAAAGLGII